MDARVRIVTSVVAAWSHAGDSAVGTTWSVLLTWRPGLNIWEEPWRTICKLRNQHQTWVCLVSVSSFVLRCSTKRDDVMWKITRVCWNPPLLKLLTLLRIQSQSDFLKLYTAKHFHALTFMPHAEAWIYPPYTADYYQRGYKCNSL